MGSQPPARNRNDLLPAALDPVAARCPRPQVDSPQALGPGSTFAVNRRQGPFSERSGWGRQRGAGKHRAIPTVQRGHGGIRPSLVHCKRMVEPARPRRTAAERHGRIKRPWRIPAKRSPHGPRRRGQSGPCLANTSPPPALPALLAGPAKISKFFACVGGRFCLDRWWFATICGPVHPPANTPPPCLQAAGL